MKVLLNRDIIRNGIILANRGEWVEVDTNFICDNQYNALINYEGVIHTVRIFDNYISRIKDDIRTTYGKCNYCGAKVKLGEEELHFKEKEENKNCENCFWYRDVLLSNDEETKEDEVDGVITRIKVITNKYKKSCTFAESNHTSKSSCTNTECREYGIIKYNENNCFFIAYPNGIPTYVLDINKFNSLNSNFILNMDWEDRRFSSMAQYYNRTKSELGSYELIMLKETNCLINNSIYFRLSNNRESYYFYYDPERDTFIVREQYTGNYFKIRKDVLPTKSTEYKKYPKCNERINKRVREIITEVYSVCQKVEISDKEEFLV